MGLTTINANNVFQKDVIGNVRTAQEDSHGIAEKTPNGDVFVVCDGMGGQVGGKTASTIAVNSILEHLKKEQYSNPAQALDEALQFANMQILGYANEHSELKGMGTTACILLLRDDQAYIAHVGDSRICLYLGKEKQLHRITKDHSYVQTLVDAGEITDDEAESHPNKNRILKALGIKAELKPTISLHPILPKNGDIFLICSDGLSGMITDETIKNVLSANFSITEKGDSLIDLALEAGGQDNITVEMIRISNSPWKKSVFRSYNPGQSASSSVRGSSNGILKWVAIVAAVLLIGFGGLYLYGNSNRNKEIKKMEDTVNVARGEFEKLDAKLSDAESTHKQAVTYTEGAKETFDLLKKALADAITSKSSTISDLKVKLTAAETYYQNKKREEETAKQQLDELTKERYYAKQKFENLETRFKLSSAEIAKQPWYEFLKFKQNESNNNRQGKEQ